MSYTGDENECIIGPQMADTSGVDEARANASPAPSSYRVSVRFDRSGLVALLHSLVVKAGGVNALALEFGVTGQFLDRVLKSKKKPGRKIIDKLGGMIFTPDPVYMIPFIKEADEEQETLILEWEPKGKTKNDRSAHKTDK